MSDKSESIFYLVSLFLIIVGFYNYGTIFVIYAIIACLIVWNLTNLIVENIKKTPTPLVGSLLVVLTFSIAVFFISPILHYNVFFPEEYVAMQEEKQTVVHVTATGEKYHRAGCRYLRQSDYEITLKKALKRGLEPCSVCDP